MTSHLMDLQDCVTGPEITALPTNEEKDRFFLKCNDRWLKNLKDNVSQDLELKARNLLGSQMQL